MARRAAVQKPGEVLFAKEVLSRVTIDTARYPHAVCNDGTPAVYYFKKSSQQRTANDRQYWLVFLEGGGWCWDEESCAQRYVESPHLMSSAPYGDSWEAGGIFSPSLPLPIADANKAYVRYCTSDAFAGDADASDSTYGWRFRGQAVVSSVLQEMARAHHLRFGDTLVFAGCSAGGRGAMFNLDYVPDMVPFGVRVVGLLDSALWVEVPSPLPQQTRDLLVMANATARLGEECAAAYGSESWRCLFGEFRISHLKLPYFITASQYDSFQLGTNLGHGPPYSPEESALVEGFRGRVRASLQSLPQADASAFSLACYQHCITEQDTLWTLTVTDGFGLRISLLDALSASDFPENFGPKVVDGCSGFQCGCPERGSGDTPARGRRRR